MKSRKNTSRKTPASRPAITLREAIGSEDPNLRQVVAILAELSVVISSEIPNHFGLSQTYNVYGEKQEKLDIWANDLISQRLLRSGFVRQVASEELDRPLSASAGEFTAVFDPIDGSSNLESNNVFGTIVGVYRDESLPAKGRNLICSMYFMYGPCLELILALKEGVRLFVDRGRGKAGDRFVSDGALLRLPEKPEVYGVGGLRSKWIDKVRVFVEKLESRGLKLRYGGSSTGDVNQILTKGGFFAYPELVDAPNGKFRLQFESNPMAFIVEGVGGRASTGSGNILDVEPSDITQRIPTYLGNSDLVAEFEHLMRT